jgi:hypothetical protein
MFIIKAMQEPSASGAATESKTEKKETTPSLLKTRKDETATKAAKSKNKPNLPFFIMLTLLRFFTVYHTLQEK